MKTYVYIDGFNFYYLALKYSDFKWLNLKELFDKLLPKHNVIKIKYFTANVSGLLDQSKPRRQEKYFRALTTFVPEIEIVKGYFQTHEVLMPLADDRRKKIRVLKTEEKCTDVNLAVHLVNDGWKGLYDCAVVVSNDGDLKEAMRIVHDELKLPIGLATPNKIKISKSLNNFKTFHKRIRNNVMKNSQLPNPIPNTTIYKPKEW